ncbi:MULTISPECIES: phosphatidylserine decarboxylase [unclassified Nocardioides]|uniref:phosphatidylserine decarboxylase n=1 Tax=unclassified Nocardioides TaxID=2615069 RepID=UPI002404F168|nr:MULTISPECIES: phosphatidylserine decarboxylase [unclassified Nocardioides]MDF9714671.1 phosphatidylserine decarboxylase [Nocardioides sp. ChNu-99]
MDLASYDAYLRGFVRWIPRHGGDPVWAVGAPHEQYSKEVAHRLAHFYWLLDQPADDDDSDTVGGSHAAFRDWMTRFAREWGAFLDTPESFSDEVLGSFRENGEEYAVEDSLMPDGRPNSPSGWLTFNQFFARELNPGLRPLAGPGDNRVVTCPGDCSYVATYAVGDDSAIPATRVKQTHTYGNLRQLLEGSAYADAFAGGTFVHYVLPPPAYHRYHLPVSGRVLESYVVPGRVYAQVELTDGELLSLDDAETGYEFSQTRGVVVLDTADSPDGDVGLVAIVPVGMSHVALVNLTTTEGRLVTKGEEFGFFQFGGSDLILLFQSGVDLDVDTGEEPRRTGTVIARCA